MPQKPVNLSPCEFVFKKVPFNSQNVNEIEEMKKILSKKNKKKNQSYEEINKYTPGGDDLEENDLVLLRDRDRESKLEPKFFGPFYITKVLGYSSYFIQSIETGKEFKVTRNDIVECGKTESFESVSSSSNEWLGYVLG